MGSKSRPYRQDAWSKAKEICQLNTRQVEMARALGMNPKKLPRLRPSPQQRWKLPVSEFIEACYRKRFGGDPLKAHPHDPKPKTHKPMEPKPDLGAPKRVGDALPQLEDLVCYLMNLTDDLNQWLASSTVGEELLPQLIQEIRGVAKALETGAPISPIPAIPQSPRPQRLVSLWRSTGERESDDDIPF